MFKRIPKAKFKTEQELAAKIVAWLEEQQWTVYQEVQPRGRGACCDIVAVQGLIVWSIECKLVSSLAVMEQAYLWRAHANFCSIATPYSSLDSAFCRRTLTLLGIGQLTAQPHSDSVSEPIRSAFYRRTTDLLRSSVREEHRHYAKAGSNAGGYYTPFKATCRELLRLVTAKPGLDAYSLFKENAFHYASSQSARSSLLKLLAQGVVPGVRLQVDGKTATLWPNT